jgi:hypothetical protein
MDSSSRGFALCLMEQRIAEQTRMIGSPPHDWATTSLTETGPTKDQ